MKRPTITDIAQRAGVTKAAVSFALNGQPGVSAATRERILAIAEEIGFQPSSAARALTAGKAGAFGLVIDRPARTLGIEPFFMQLISGIQADLAAHQVTLLFTMTEDPDAEIELYRQWWAQRRVDGVFVVDLQVDDRRIAVLEELRMPAVVIGTPRGAGHAARGLAGRPRLPWRPWSATSPSRGTGASPGSAAGPRTGTRCSAARRSQAAAAIAGLTAFSVEADYTAEHGARMPRSACSARRAADRDPVRQRRDGGRRARRGAADGRQRARRVSIVSWDDSALCELMHPALTALRGTSPAPVRPRRGCCARWRPAVTRRAWRRPCRTAGQGELRIGGAVGASAARPHPQDRVARARLARFSSSLITVCTNLDEFVLTCGYPQRDLVGTWPIPDRDPSDTKTALYVDATLG